jgi:hypothetical protein
MSASREPQAWRSGQGQGWGGGVREAEEGARGVVHLGFAELVEVAHELQDVHARASRERERRAVVAQVLPERVPVAALLRLVAAGRARARVLLRLNNPVGDVEAPGGGRAHHQGG